MIACTELSSVGWNVVLIVPVVASNAAMYGCVITGEPAVFCCSWVNVPPMTIVLPTCAIASTSPSRTLGVQFAGSAETTDGWKVCTAEARRDAEAHHRGDERGQRRGERREPPTGDGPSRSTTSR